jgi:hypothetical protein
MNTENMNRYEVLATVTVSEKARKLVWGEPKPKELISLSLSDLGLQVEHGSIQKELVVKRAQELKLKPCRMETAIQLWLDLQDKEFRSKIWKDGVSDSLFIFTEPTQDCTLAGPTVAIRIEFHEVSEYVRKPLSLLFYRGHETLSKGAFYPNWKYVFAKEN